MRIDIKLMVVFLAFIVIPVIFVSYMVFYNSKSIIEKEMFSKLNVIADQKRDEVVGFFKKGKADLRSLQGSDVYKNNISILEQFCDDRSNPSYIDSRKEIELRLSHIRRIYKHVDIMLTNMEGRIIYASNPENDFELGHEISDKDHAFSRVKTGIYLGDVYKSIHKKYPYTVFLTDYGYDDAGKVFGLIRLELDAGTVFEILRKYSSEGESLEALLVDKRANGEVVFISPQKFEPQGILKRTVTLGSPVSLPAQKAVSGENGSGTSIDYRGTEVLAAWRTIPSLGWGLVVKIDSDEAFMPVQRLKKLLIVVIFATVFSAALAAFTIAKSISDPIRELHKGAEIIGRGNLDYKVGMDTDDEVGRLSRAFDNMTVNLRASTTSIEELNKEMIERQKAQERLRDKTSELDAALQESGKSRKILMSMLEDNNQIREKLALSEALFRNIFEEAGDGILIVDAQNRRFHMSNKAFCRMFGYSQEEMVNLWITDLHFEKDFPNMISQFEKQTQAKAGAGVLINDMPMKRKDGSVFYVDFSSTRISISGKPYEMAFFHDLSESREVEDLKRLDQLKKRFIANMSHELRTPLNAVIGFSEVLADQKFGVLNATQKDYLNDILESAKFLLSLINDILDLAKIEAGKLELSLSDFSFNELLENSLMFVRERALRHHIELFLNIAEEVGTIRADERAVKLIMNNLLSNAVKFTGDGGKVGINAKSNGTDVEITVWDSGMGIAAEDQNKIFDEFVQLENPQGKKSEGTGLGLSLVKKLVDLHQGMLRVESEGPGKGASFTFSLPIAGVESISKEA